MFFTRGQAIVFIEKVFGSVKLTNNGREINVSCPICNDTFKKKLAIRSDNFLTHCWVCGYKARNLIELIKKYYSNFLSEYIGKYVGTKVLLHESELGEYEDNAADEQKITLPTGFKLLVDQPEQSYIDYLNERFDGELTEKDLWYWKFGITTEDYSYQQRVLMPSHDLEGNLNYFTGRTIDPRVKPKYLNPMVPRESIIFNELNIDWEEPLVICEGPFDLIKASENATCLLGSELTPDYRLFEMILKHNTPIVLALDNDAHSKTMRIAQLLHDFDVNIKILRIPEPYNDIGEIPRSQFKNIFDGAMIYSMDFKLRDRIANIL